MISFRFKNNISLLLFFAMLFSFLPKSNTVVAQIDGFGGAVSNLGTGGGGLLDMPSTGVSESGLGIGTAAEGASPLQVQDRTSWLQNILKSIKDSWYQAMDIEQGRELTVKEYFLDPLAWTAANVIIDKFGDAMVDWIRSGFDGSPMFLSDPEGFFRDTANDFSGAIIDALDMEWLCDPLGKLRINLDFFFPGTDRAKYRCTFNDIAGTFESYADRDDISDWISVNANVRERNIVRLYGSDYRNGGFLMWLFTAQKKNNDLGRTLQTADDVYAAVNARVGIEGFQLDIYKGFFGVKKCVEWEDVQSGSKKCLKYETRTPGNLVQDQLENSTNKDLRRLQVADEVDEIIGALATTMMGWLLTGGNDGGGVLGYDKDSDYSGSKRDHYGELNKNQQTINKKSNISSQIQTIKGREENYGEMLNEYADILYDTKEKMEIVLAKLKCIKATSTAVASDNADCDGADEDIKNISLSAVDKTESDIISDISKTEDKISDIDTLISNFNGKYGDNATSTTAQALELFDEFENEVMNAGSLGKITSITNEYCYSYNKNNKTGKICGLFGEKSSGDSMAVYISGESNPATQDNAGVIKTKIYWKALNAESCQATGGDSDKTWKKTEISTSGSYTTTSFEDGESRNYGVECSDAENNNTSTSTDISADSSVAAEMFGSLFAKNTFVKSGESSSLYWLSTNASQCYLYSDQDSFSGDAEYVTSSSDGWFVGGEGYYLKTSLTKTTGQSTATFNAGETFQYKLICGDSGDNYSVLSELEISSEDGEKETYKTHTQKEYNLLSKETVKTEIKAENLTLGFTCILDDYTQNEDVTKSECSSFEESSSSSSSE